MNVPLNDTHWFLPKHNAPYANIFTVESLNHWNHAPITPTSGKAQFASYSTHLLPRTFAEFSQSGGKHLAALNKQTAPFSKKPPTRSKLSRKN